METKQMTNPRYLIEINNETVWRWAVQDTQNPTAHLECVGYSGESPDVFMAYVTAMAWVDEGETFRVQIRSKHTVTVVDSAERAATVFGF